jgi:outer membrane protein OmpA-like peptidoglycan-associated protein/pimeloyl-ACP methyl ester carboxylesterase
MESRLFLAVAMILYVVVGSACQHEVQTKSMSIGEQAKMKDARKPNTTSSRWVHQNTERRPDTAIVYVHGIFGDTLGTWQNAETGKYFYDLIAADPAYNQKADQFAFGFPSKMFSQGSFTIQEAANALYSQLLYYGVLQYPRIVFVTHSMGGLVVLESLLTNREVIPRIPLIVFFGAPQEGSQITTLARHLLSNPALEEMLPADRNAYLQRLNDQWMSIDATKRPAIACAYEKLAIAGVTIVPWASATRFCTRPATAIEADHIDLVKPDSTDSLSYIALANALSNYAFPSPDTDHVGGALETPDFSVAQGKATLLISDPRGKREVHIGNVGASPLRYILEQFPDTGLYVIPSIGPHLLKEHDTDVLNFIVGFGATASDYQFVLKSSAAPPLPVAVHVKNLQQVSDFHDHLASQLAERLLAEFHDGRSASGGFPVSDINPEAVAQSAKVVIERNFAQMAASNMWVFAAQLLDAVNWPKQAVYALRQAAEEDVSITDQPEVRKLAARIGYLAGESAVFANVDVNQGNAKVLRDSLEGNPLAKDENRAAAFALAELLLKFPSSRELGHSLSGDIAFSHERYYAASSAYSAGLSRGVSPSLYIRLADTQSRNSNQVSAASTLRTNQEKFPGPLSAQLANMESPKPTNRVVGLTLGDVLFDTGRAELKMGDDEKLEQLAQFLSGHPSRKIRVEGFSDSVGSTSAGRKVSERRAEAVRSALMARGIDGSRISTAGYGSAFPIASNADPAGRELNRRVEIVIDDSDDKESPPSQ